MAKETGWHERDILGMPVYRVLAYYWAALRGHGCWTVKRSAPADEQISDLMEFARKVPEEY